MSNLKSEQICGSNCEQCLSFINPAGVHVYSCVSPETSSTVIYIVCIGIFTLFCAVIIIVIIIKLKKKNLTENITSQDCHKKVNIQIQKNNLRIKNEHGLNDSMNNSLDNENKNMKIAIPKIKNNLKSNSNYSIQKLMELHDLNNQSFWVQNSKMNSKSTQLSNENTQNKSKEMIDGINCIDSNSKNLLEMSLKRRNSKLSTNNYKKQTGVKAGAGEKNILPPIDSSSIKIKQIRKKVDLKLFRKFKNSIRVQNKNNENNESMNEIKQID